MADLPRGKVTLVFTDIEGSTRLLQDLGEEIYVQALEDHRQLLREAFIAHGGVEVEMQGDAFHFAFVDPSEAVLAAARAQRVLADHAWEREPIRVRIGMHTGEPLVTGRLYAGLDVHRAARVMSAGHGGQILVSEQTFELVRDELADGLSLRDLGEHRLKDLSAPQRLYQVGEDEFPPLNSLYRTNMPVPTSSFIGRELELETVTALLAEQETHLLTLTGAGGSGKTRLAAQAAADASDSYPDGVFWVALAGLRDPALVTSTITQAVGAKNGLADHIGAKRLLLLLDNFEHLLPAANELAALVATCPKLTVLVTSREPLHLSSEREYAVLPLREPDAVSLFRERVRAANIDLTAGAEVTEICRRLDHLPLAIELAAARARVLPAKALLEMLDERLPLLTGGARDLPERHRTLKATISWSHDLLTPEEKRLFARLSAFAGGCTLEAAKRISDADLDALQSLVEKSLLRHSNGRFLMLETIREFAADALESGKEADGIRLRHATFFTDFAERAHIELRGPNKAEWLERLQDDLENARAALGWESTSTHTHELQLRLAAALRLFWDSVGSSGEGLRWIERGLERVEAPAARIRYDAYLGAAAFASQLGDFAKAFDYDARALAAARELDDPTLIATALMRTAIDMRRTGELSRARELYEQALGLAEGGGDDHLAGAITHNLGDLALAEGDFERAQALFRRAIASARDRSDPHETAYALCNLALATLKVDSPRAIGHLCEAMSIIAGLSWPFGVVYSLELAGDALAEEDPHAAAQLLAKAEAMRLELELPLDPFEQAVHDESLGRVMRTLGAEAHSRAAEIGLSLGEDQVLDYALDRLRKARLSLAR